MSVIKIENLTFAYPGSADNVFENLNLQLDTGWKLGLVGRNGRGKTTLLKLLTGEYEYSGRIESRAQFDYFPYSVDGSEGGVLDVLRSVCPEAEDWQIERELSLLGIDSGALVRPFSTLSNGERTNPACGAFPQGRAFPAHRRTHKPPGRRCAQQSVVIPQPQARLYTGLARQELPRRLCGPHSLAQPLRSRSARRQLLCLVCGF